ncbi:alpha/beta fold hydrolase [Undibacterium sp. SXout11W]|uniref:alpha/beta fold hydrolase n=1 Tax=Undibacterium sp. SXout11W TaxID=3413050 RepID=UPI003BF08419
MATQLYPSKDILFTPQAFWFGESHAPLLGWYHPARKRDLGGSRQCGVVLCPPFGHEYMVSYLSYKHLANTLAKAGFDVLFFDYNNSGDSANLDGDRVVIWQSNILAAAAQLRQIAGIEQITLFGLRLGALLAASIAKDIQASALVMLAPAVSGRAYCRELQVLRNMSALQSTSAAAPAASAEPAATAEKNESEKQISDDELTGYEFSTEMRSSIGKLDMLKMPAPDIPVLIISRDDVAGQEEKLANSWSQSNPHLHLSSSPGYAGMMKPDAHDTKVPDEIWLEVAAWLTPLFEIQPAPANDDINLETAITLKISGQAITENLVSFEELVGVVSRPVSRASQTLPTVLLTNIGANHRVGNHQLYVKLARDLAAAGFTVLRFDKAGIGYSKPTSEGKENDVYANGGVNDIRSAMQFMRIAFGSEHFVVGGLCSGAYFCYLTALEEASVKGVILMNQLVYHWNEGDSLEARRKESIKSTHFYVKAIRNLHTWKRVLRGDIQFRQIFVKLSRRVTKRLHILSQAFITKFVESHHFLGKVARQFKQMEARGIEILMIMDAGDSSVDLMTENFGRHGVLLGKSPRIKLEILKGADHTFTPRWAQKHVVNLITTHLQKRFQAASANAEK